MALLESLLRQGKAAEAIVVADEVWHRRDGLTLQALDTFALQLTNLGQYGRSAELTTLELVGSAHWPGRYRLNAFNAGDLEGFERHGTVLDRAFVACIRAKGIDGLFAEHQAVLRRHLCGKQVDVQLCIAVDDDTAGAPGLTQNFSVASSFTERTSLEEAILSELADLYAAVGSDVFLAWDKMTPMIMGIDAALWQD